jgi:hypothetical protein
LVEPQISVDVDYLVVAGGGGGGGFGCNRGGGGGAGGYSTSFPGGTKLTLTGYGPFKNFSSGCWRWSRSFSRYSNLVEDALGVFRKSFNISTITSTGGGGGRMGNPGGPGGSGGGAQ